VDESRHSPEPHLDPDEPTTLAPDDVDDAYDAYDTYGAHDTYDETASGEDAEHVARVRALLAAPDPDPGPMPHSVADRISAALAQEARLRVDRGPLADASAPTGPHEHATVLEMRRPQRRHRPYYLAAAVAAAALVVAAGASALHLAKRPNSTAVIGGGFTSSTPGASTAAPGASGGSGVHIQLGNTAYTAATLGPQARDLLDHPGAPLRPGAAEAPAIGPIGTEVGLASCLEGLGVGSPAPSAVSADLATFEGRPAAVVVVTRDGASSVWVVERSCSAQAPGVLHPETPVP
jgi:hypothetical protein